MTTNANEQPVPPVMTYDQYMENLRSLVLNEDVRRVIAEASDEDRVALATSIIEEAIAYEDYQMARSLASDNEPSQMELLSSLFGSLGAPSTLPDQLSEHGAGPSSSSGHRFQNREPAQATRASDQRTTDSSTRRDCTACQEPVAVLDLITAPCGHDYCKDCIRHLFTRAIGDDELFPPRCCRQAIPISSVGSVLSRDEQHAFMQKLVEFNTADKTYCSRSSCSAFIPGSNTANEVAVCPRCRTRTCTICKSKAHAGRDCPRDTGLQEVLNMADQEGWQRCYRCGRMTELVDGCNTVTCRCGASFCHACGKRWKTCYCALFNEQNSPLLVADDFAEPIDHVPNDPERHQGADTHMAHILRFREAPPPVPVYDHAHPQHADHESEAYPDQHRHRFRYNQHVPEQPTFLQTPSRPQNHCTHFMLQEHRRHNLGARCHRCNDRRKGRTWECKSCGLESCTQCLLDQEDLPVSFELRARIRGPFSREYAEYFG